ncbi:hypothetical protein [Paraburkholderia phosphatilytica]|uniref:hypothetical protein n=1 Tax=Paraburkholderia phosphatilytica TaxID=2282883 RepID=UPI000F5F35D2|nr:hypothetical protein [Paraburkholderia phosphatilytica]
MSFAVVPERVSLTNTLCRVVLLAACAATSFAARADVKTPEQYCRQVGNDDTLREIPDSLAPKVQKLFGIDSADDAKLDVTSRCMNGKLIACNSGANLPCGKANVKRVNPAANQYCNAHPNDDVPAGIAGHDSVYTWHCHGISAQAGSAQWHVDARGFVSEVWKPVP